MRGEATAAGALVVGVDLATGFARATCADAEGRIRAAASAPLPGPVRQRPGWVEQDPVGWWPAVAAAVRRVTRAIGAERSRVRAVTVAGTSGTVVVTDRLGRALGPALLYADQRAVEEARRAREAGGGRWELSGLRIEPGFGLPKLAWMLRREPWRTGAAWCWHAPDLILFHLLGEPPPTDWSHALKTGYDPARGEWPQEVLEALAVPETMLPEVLPPASPAGAVCAEAAGETGLPEGCEVRLGMTDGCAAQVAAGAHRPGRFVGVLGTTLVVRGASEVPVRDRSGAVYSHRHPQGWWLPGGASSTGAGALGDVTVPAVIHDLDRRAAHRGPARVVCYPLIGRGERFPFVRPDAEPFLLGEPVDEIERHRCVLEGVGFVERLCYARLRSLGLPIRPPLAAAGGGSRSEAWTRIRATVLGLPLAVPPQADTAFGACVLAAAGTLHPDLSTAVEAMVRPGPIVEPDAAEDLEENYRRLVSALTERGWLDEALVAAALAPAGP